jgi:hypothetical protein
MFLIQLPNPLPGLKPRIWELDPGYSKEFLPATSLEVKKLASICTKLGHKCIDVLKMDIEGSEHIVIPDILRSNITVCHILIELLHHIMNVRVEKTVETIKKLNRHGYLIFDVSASGNEYSIIGD